jgi:glycolate oxidase iron-sulfur subunit
MQTTLAPSMANDADARDAGDAIRRCVHCGFCNATCPTYQLLGDELDGPRGRIYQIRQVLEGEARVSGIREHLDRCLTCRACETSCPSGVEYGRLLDSGRRLLERTQPRGARERLSRRLLAAFLTGPLFAPVLAIGRALRPALPAALAARIPSSRPAGAWPTTSHARRVLLLQGCVQPALSPSIDVSTARVLGALGIETVRVNAGGCCGSIHQHLGLQQAALQRARDNIDAWWPHVEAGAEAVISSASGCAVQLREYGHLLRDDPRHAQRAARISVLARDVSEMIAPEAARLAAKLAPPRQRRIAFQSPCSLQHGLRRAGAVEAMLRELGAELMPVVDAHLCCGSAGTYSLLQPAISRTLGAAKVASLMASSPERILSANVGCMHHLAAAPVPVTHWIEWVDERLAG